MRRNIYVGIILLMGILLFSQTIEANYERILVNNPILNSDEKEENSFMNMISEEEKETFKAFMSKPEVFILKHSQGISSYFEKPISDEESEKSMSIGEEGDVFISIQRSASQSLWYKDFNSQKTVANEEILGRMFIIEESFQSYNWILEAEEKKIGDLQCKKASTTIDGEKVTAYYTEEVPISDGPKLYYGLPGLIVELKTPQFEYHLTSLQISDGNQTIEMPKEGKKVTREKFEAMKEEKMGKNGVFIQRETIVK